MVVDTATLTTKVVTALGDKALPIVLDELAHLGTLADTPWKKSLVTTAKDLVAAHGPQGLAILEGLATTLRSGGAPDLSDLPLATASEVLAVLQRQEADHKKEVQDFLNSLLDSLVKIVAILATTLFKEL